MENVLAVFEYMKESTWIQSLEKYGYPLPMQYEVPAKLPEILLDLYESTWAEDLYMYKRDIEEGLGIKFMTVKEMRNVYLTDLHRRRAIALVLLLKVDGVGFDIAEKISNLVV